MNSEQTTLTETHIPNPTHWERVGTGPRSPSAVSLAVGTQPCDSVVVSLERGVATARDEAVEGTEDETSSLLETTHVRSVDHVRGQAVSGTFSGH